jgi:hypothetical protein
MEEIKTLLQQVEGYEKIMPSSPPEDDPKMTVLHDMVQQVKSQTEGYTNPHKINTENVDVRPILMRENIEPDEWIRHKGKMTRSEIETLKWLIDELNSKLSKKESKPDAPATNSRIKIAKAKMKMAKSKLALAKEKLMLLNLK